MRDWDLPRGQPPTGKLDNPKGGGMLSKSETVQRTQSIMDSMSDLALGDHPAA
jgi:hypothetical protein